MKSYPKGTQTNTNTFFMLLTFSSHFHIVLFFMSNMLYEYGYTNTMQQEHRLVHLYKFIINKKENINYWTNKKT